MIPVPSVMTTWTPAENGFLNCLASVVCRRTSVHRHDEVTRCDLHEGSSVTPSPSRLINLDPERTANRRDGRGIREGIDRRFLGARFRKTPDVGLWRFPGGDAGPVALTCAAAAVGFPWSGGQSTEQTLIVTLPGTSGDFTAEEQGVPAGCSRKRPFGA